SAMQTSAGSAIEAAMASSTISQTAWWKLIPWRRSPSNAFGVTLMGISYVRGPLVCGTGTGLVLSVIFSIVLFLFSFHLWFRRGDPAGWILEKLAPLPLAPRAGKWYDDGAERVCLAVNEFCVRREGCCRIPHGFLF